MRVEFRTLFALALCAAASAAALAHFAIDVVGDSALGHDAYDGLAHGSREYAAALALLFAVIAAARGLRACCELAHRTRGRLAKPDVTWTCAAGYAGVAVSLACVLVPLMEWVDDALGAVPLASVGDAFGGSLLLGFGTTLLCAVLVAGLFYALARWLLAHRDIIVAMVASLLQRRTQSTAAFHNDRTVGGLRRPTSSPAAFCLAKRGPPVALFVYP